MLAPITETPTTWICSECGSDKVAGKVWFDLNDPNDKKTLRDFCFEPDCSCDGCGSYPVKVEEN